MWDIRSASSWSTWVTDLWHSKSTHFEYVKKVYVHVGGKINSDNITAVKEQVFPVQKKQVYILVYWGYCGSRKLYLFLFYDGFLLIWLLNV